MSVRNSGICRNIDGDDNVRVKGAFKILCLRVRDEDLGKRGVCPVALESPIWPSSSCTPMAQVDGAKGVCPPGARSPSRRAPSIMVATSHRGLFVFKLTKENSVPQMHYPHLRCLIATCGLWLLYSIAQIL